MPIVRKQDSTGPYFQYGPTGHKYHYIPRNNLSRAIAFKKTLKQARAIIISKKRVKQVS